MFLTKKLSINSWQLAHKVNLSQALGLAGPFSRSDFLIGHHQVFWGLWLLEKRLLVLYYIACSTQIRQPDSAEPENHSQVQFHSEICTTWMVYLRDFVVSNVSNLQKLPFTDWRCMTINLFSVGMTIILVRMSVIVFILNLEESSGRGGWWICRTLSTSHT